MKNLTWYLIKLIGTPFNPPILDFDLSRELLNRLYRHAKLNKISLLYLEALNNLDLLSKAGLEDRWIQENHEYEEQRGTIVRIARILNEMDIDYALFKSIFPFKMITNDIDILLLGGLDDYRLITDILSRYGYSMIVHISSPYQITFHDERVRRHINPEIKDIYDIDIYREAGASYIIYMDKRKFIDHVITADVNGVKVRSLSPYLDILVLYTHAIIPEFIFTLSLYYTTLHYISILNSGDIIKMIRCAIDNNVYPPLKFHLSLISGIHKYVYGSLPPKIEKILSILGLHPYTFMDSTETPFHYNWETIYKTIAGKMGDLRFVTSLYKQVATISRPRYLLWVNKVILERRKRATY
jgi:hypothetical protein